MKYLNGIIDSIQRTNYDPDATAFFLRINAAGGNTTLTEKNAVNQLVLDLKANSLWTSMLAIYPMVGSSAASCAQNLKSSSYTGIFSGGWTYASTGITGNGTNSYMDTNFNSKISLIPDSSHISYYSRTSLPANTEGDMGAYGTFPTNFYTHIRYLGDAYYVLLAIEEFQSVSNNTTLGFFNGNRNTYDVSHFRNGINLGTTIQNSAPLPDLNTYLCAINASEIAISFNTKQCAFSSIGTGLTDIQSNNFYTVVQSFQTSLSRQV